MKIYRLYDDSTETLVTADRLTALEHLYALVKKYAGEQYWFAIEEDEI